MDKFHPICKAMASGDMVTFRRLLDYDTPQAAWFVHFRIMLQLRSRGEVLVWRSLIRKTFLLSGFQGDDSKRLAPTVALRDVLDLLQALDHATTSQDYQDPDLDGVDDDKFTSTTPDMLEVESIFSSLIDQGFLNGYISHSRLKFAIQGAKQKGGALNAGFPNVWSTISSKSDENVPGWKRQAAGFGQGGFGPGMVVNLSGARPVSSGG